jgi:ABC-type siderophore export system fused ATPase/permease subunit
MQRESGAWGYNWDTMSLGDINTGTWSYGLRVGHKAVAKSKEVKTRPNLEESFKEGYCSKSAVLQLLSSLSLPLTSLLLLLLLMMMMMMMMMIMMMVMVMMTTMQHKLVHAN